MNHSSSGLILLTIYFLLAIYLAPFLPSSVSGTEAQNRASAAALVEDTSFEISRFEPTEGAKFKSVKRDGDKVYPSAPGFAIVSAPFYALTRLVLGPANDGNLATGVYALRLLLASFPLLLLGIWLYSSEVDAFSLGTLLFATPLFPLSLLYTSEAFVAVLIYLAFRVIYDFRRVMPGRCFTAGLFLGFCLLCDVRTVLPAVVIGAGILFTGGRETGTRLLYFLAGVIPFLAALLLYSWFILGGLGEAVPSASLAIPGFYDLYLNWFSPQNGLFFYSPVLLYSLAAMFTSKQSGGIRSAVKYGLIILSLLLVPFWRTGAEYAIPASGFAIVLLLFLDPLFDGEADEYQSVIRGSFFSLSILLFAIPVLTAPFAPTDLSYPHNSFWQPLMLNLAFGPNILGFFAFSSQWAVLFPAFLFILISWAVLRTARYPGRFLVGLLAGIAIVSGYLFFADLEQQKAEPFVEKHISALS